LKKGRIVDAESKGVGHGRGGGMQKNDGTGFKRIQIGERCAAKKKTDSFEGKND